MKRSFKVLGLITAVVVSSAAFAYGPGGNCEGGRGGKHHGMNIIMMEKVLDLSEAQKQEIQALQDEQKALREAHRAEMQSERPARGMELDPGASDYNDQVAALADKKAELTKARILRQAEYRAKIFAILTESQREEWKAFHQEMRENHKGNRNIN